MSAEMLPLIRLYPGEGERSKATEWKVISYSGGCYAAASLQPLPTV